MGRPKKLSNEAIEVLASMAFEGNQARITTGDLDRKLYTEVNEVLAALGGKWNRKAKAHVFENDPQAAIEQVTIDGTFTDEKREFEFFATPLEVAAKLIESLDIQPNDKVLEPSCGEGALIRAVLGKQSKAEITAIDIRQSSIDKLIDHVQTYSLNVTLIVGDFLKQKPGHNLLRRQFDFIVMNPPFSKQQDIDHILHAHKFLKAGGNLVSIAGAGLQFRSNRKTVEFREFVQKHGGTIEPLPPSSFKSSGTNVNTVIVKIPA